MARLVFEDKIRTNEQKIYKIKHHDTWRQVSLSLQTSRKEWWEDPAVVVAFNFPRISAQLERLTGTNIVRLTDHNYMKDLRKRIDLDYLEQLMKRIRARELREIERERLLIIEGKTDIIPAELIDDPIFLVNKVANIDIQKARAKLKTKRERNAERLKLQGVKWERERLIHEEEERQRALAAKARRKAQKELIDRYRNEDAVRGMDLLRIENEDWRDCEQNLKEFLEQERAKMKARSLKVSTPYTSDPLDMMNIERAKAKAREEKRRQKKELETKGKTPQERKELQRTKTVEVEDINEVRIPSNTSLQTTLQREMNIFLSDFYDETLMEQKRYSDDDSSLLVDLEFGETFSSISESKRRHAEALKAEMDDEVQRGLLISKEQYDHLRYENDKIQQLRNATDLRALYQLAEEIIIGDRFEEEEIIEVEEEIDEEAEEEQLHTETETDKHD